MSALAQGEDQGGSLGDTPTEGAEDPGTRREAAAHGETRGSPSLRQGARRQIHF